MDSSSVVTGEEDERILGDTKLLQRLRICPTDQSTSSMASQMSLSVRFQNFDTANGR